MIITLAYWWSLIFAINVVMNKPAWHAFVFPALAVGLTPQLLPAIIGCSEILLLALEPWPNSLSNCQLSSIERALAIMNDPLFYSKLRDHYRKVKRRITFGVPGYHGQPLGKHFTMHVNASLQQGSNRQLTVKLSYPGKARGLTFNVKFHGMKEVMNWAKCGLQMVPGRWAWVGCGGVGASFSLTARRFGNGFDCSAHR